VGDRIFLKQPPIMNNYQIVLVNFFSEKKTYRTIKASDHIEADKKANLISRQNPEFVVAVYYNENLIIGLRPNGMESELKKMGNSKFEDLLKFMNRWKINPFTGTQDYLPDFSLPEDSSVFSEENLSTSEGSKSGRGRPQKPHRVSEMGISQPSSKTVYS
jgi:hypothetical protein